MTKEYSIKLVGIIAGTGLALYRPCPWPTESQEGKCSQPSLVESFGPMSSSILGSSCWVPPEPIYHILIHYYIYHSHDHQTGYQNCLIFLMKFHSTIKSLLE